MRFQTKNSLPEIVRKIVGTNVSFVEPRVQWSWACRENTESRKKESMAPAVRESFRK